MNKLNFTKENCRKLAELEGKFDIEVPYTIAGFGVGHIKASDLLKSKKVKAQLENLKEL